MMINFFSPEMGIVRKHGKSGKIRVIKGFPCGVNTTLHQRFPAFSSISSVILVIRLFAHKVSPHLHRE
jgi:hypothetical protein